MTGKLGMYLQGGAIAIAALASLIASSAQAGEASQTAPAAAPIVLAAADFSHPVAESKLDVVRGRWSASDQQPSKTGETSAIILWDELKTGGGRPKSNPSYSVGRGQISSTINGHRR